MGFFSSQGSSPEDAVADPVPNTHVPLYMGLCPPAFLATRASPRHSPSPAPVAIFATPGEGTVPCEMLRRAPVPAGGLLLRFLRLDFLVWHFRDVVSVVFDHLGGRILLLRLALPRPFVGARRAVHLRPWCGVNARGCTSVHPAHTSSCAIPIVLADIRQRALPAQSFDTQADGQINLAGGVGFSRRSISGEAPMITT